MLPWQLQQVNIFAFMLKKNEWNAKLPQNITCSLFYQPNCSHDSKKKKKQHFAWQLVKSNLQNLQLAKKHSSQLAALSNFPFLTEETVSEAVIYRLS